MIALNGAERALAITNVVVELLRAHSGRGPTRARTVVSPDLVVVHLRDCLTVAEKSIQEHGCADLVVRGRDVLHAAIREEATAAVERITGRQVVAYLSTQETNPDHGLIVVVLDGCESASAMTLEAAFLERTLPAERDWRDENADEVREYTQHLTETAAASRRRRRFARRALEQEGVETEEVRLYLDPDDGVGRD